MGNLLFCYINYNHPELLQQMFHDSQIVCLQNATLGFYISHGLALQANILKQDLFCLFF